MTVVVLLETFGIVIDVDSTVKTAYGKQQGVKKGYNPFRKGKASYHPILAFCAETKEILQGWLRSGDAYTSNGIVEFTKQLLAHLPKSQTILFRGDSGFFNSKLFDLLDRFGHGYLVKVKLKGLKKTPFQPNMGGNPEQGRLGTMHILASMRQLEMCPSFCCCTSRAERREERR